MKSLDPDSLPLVRIYDENPEFRRVLAESLCDFGFQVEVLEVLSAGHDRKLEGLNQEQVYIVDVSPQNYLPALALAEQCSGRFGFVLTSIYAAADFQAGWLEEFRVRTCFLQKPFLLHNLLEFLLSLRRNEANSPPEN